MKKLFSILTVIITIFLMSFIIYAFRLGILEDKMVLVRQIRKYGIFAGVFFVLLQIGQVVLPIIPGGASCLAGVLAFGPIRGFAYNYIGLVIGSILAFVLARYYGIKVVKKLFSKDTIDKYWEYVQSSRFSFLFFWGIFLPGFPDDLLCYIAGLSKMRFHIFLIIILLGKPITLIGYSLFTSLF